MPYAVTADITARVGGPIDANSEPTSTEVTDWIAEVGVELDGVLENAAFTAPVTGANPLLFVKQKVVARVGAKVLERRTASTNYQNPELIARLNAEWMELLDAIRGRQAELARQIGQSIAGARNRGAFRSHVTDNSLDKSAADGDFGPTFKIDDEL